MVRGREHHRVAEGLWFADGSITGSPRAYGSRTEHHRVAEGLWFADGSITGWPRAYGSRTEHHRVAEGLWFANGSVITDDGVLIVGETFGK